MKYFKLLLTVALSLGVASCATPISKTEIDSADYGTPIAQADAEVKLKEFFGTLLKDPYSAVYTFEAIRKGGISESKFYGGRKYFGYRLNGTVNAKNSMGGYIGQRKFEAIFVNGTIATVYHEVSRSGGTMMDKLK